MENQRTSSWVGRLECRKREMSSRTGLRGWQKQKPKESIVGNRRCN